MSCAGCGTNISASRANRTAVAEVRVQSDGHFGLVLDNLRCDVALSFSSSGVDGGKGVKDWIAFGRGTG